MKTRSLVLVSCILGFLVLMAAIVGMIGSQSMFPDRTNPSLHVSVTSWQGGQVGFCDYSTFPGTYNWKLEWHSHEGKRQTLMVLGDISTPSCKVMPDGSFSVLHQDAIRVRQDDRLPVVTTFSTPFSEPMKGSGTRQATNSEGVPPNGP